MSITASRRRRDRAPRPVPVLAALCAALLAVVAADDAAAQSSRNRVGARIGGRLWIDSTALLEPVTSFDLRTNGEGLAVRRTVTATVDRTSTGTLRTRLAPPASTAPVTTVNRRIDRLWRLEIGDAGAAAATRVDYDVVGANGMHGVLSHTSNDRSMIGVRVVELPARQIGRAGFADAVEGGVMLEMNLDRALEAGTYAGSLRVTVFQL